MTTHAVPDRWRTRLREHILATTGEDRDQFRAHDFQGDRSLRLDFPDGSFALFRYAFHLQDEHLREVAVFTEHCGYHFFPSGELRVEELETEWVEDAR
ncbi:MAG TPA: hypothetical protein VF665_08475 [Longimicrobium sp.]|jgi:hypothetical protein|uniref:hypothetical protein n=1 Tax=Longimicrobium sp. TaxID=2029185 RepID=UPI002ED82956